MNKFEQVQGDPHLVEGHHGIMSIGRMGTPDL